jgi:hypothetical protein
MVKGHLAAVVFPPTVSARWRRGVAPGLLLFTLLGTAAGSDSAVATALVLGEGRSVRLDGYLDEEAWRAAVPIGPLVQTEPAEGVPPTEATEVRVLVDEARLYVGIRCFDSSPSAVVVSQLARDSELDVDDHVLVVVDPLLDRRNGYFFQVNAAGARSDGQLFNNPEELNYDWDGIWEARTSRDDGGWSVEMAIPFKTVRSRTDQNAWGFNVERLVKRKLEKSRWSAPRRDVWISNLAEAGRLEGTGVAEHGRGLDIRPYLSSGEDEGFEISAGIDVFKSLTPGLLASVTVNTDFAETEADDRQVNLTRFPLFFPEKRAFFLEGSGLYDIAGLVTNNDLLPFFSRRIGLLQGEEVPILAGAKLLGRQGNYNIAFLDVLTREQESRGLQDQNLLAARVSRSFFEQSWVGAIVTHGNPAGDGSNTLLGADARFATSNFRGGQNLSLDLYVMRTADERSGTDHAFGFKFDYPNDLWDVALNWKQIGDDFEPALGFVPRAGIRKANASMTFSPRPGRWGIRQFFFRARPEHITDLDNTVQNWRVSATPLSIVFESGDYLQFNVVPEYERLPAPFEIEDDVVLPASSYRWTRWGVEASTASKRRWVVELGTSWGGFYDGRLRQLDLELIFKPSPRFIASLEMEVNDVLLPAGDFRAEVYGFRTELNLSSDLSWANLIQYDTDSELLGLQSRVRWTVRPEAELFMVFNRGWVRENGAYLPRFDSGSVKFQYTWRL